VNLEKLTDGSKNAIVDGPFGTQMKVAEYIDQGIPVVEMSYLKGFIIQKDFTHFISPQKYRTLKRSAVQSGDILLSKTGTLGLVGIFPDEVENGIIVSRLAKITPHKHIPIRYFIFCGLKELLKSGYWLKVATGSTMPIINLSHIKTVKFVKPSDELLKSFEKIANTNYQEINLLQKKNSLLRQTRDLILPKLVSGEMDVSEMEIENFNEIESGV
jgi:type I restriction enzyme S subunit